MAALFDDKLITADHEDAAAVASDSGPGRSSGPSETPVSAAFAGILPEDPRQDAVQEVPTNSAEPNEFSAENQGVAARPIGSDHGGRALATSPASENPLSRPKIIFQPVMGGVDSRGNALLRPDVRVAADKEFASGGQDVRLAQFPAEDNLPLPPQAQLAPEMAHPVDENWMPPVVASDCGDACSDGYGSEEFLQGMNGYGNGNGYGHGHGNRHGHRHARGSGVGKEYVMHAPFFLDRTEPYNNCFIRGDAAANWEFPDRAEYFWAKTPGGKGPVDPAGAVNPLDPNGPLIPRGERSVDYQDVVFSIERGTERVSVATDIPIRAVDPEFRNATTGLADMEVTSKIVFLDGCRWQLTQLFSTHLPTGSFRRGTGNGHVSLEPGVAYRWKWTDLTYIHGDLTYLFPIGADPNHSGQILNYGIGISHVWIDADTYALIPTFEIDAWTVLDGRQTLPGVVDPGGPDPPVAVSEEVDSIGIINVHPGLRWVCDKGRDCGVKEFGISSGICVTQDSWYEEILRIEFRWSH